MGRSGASQRHRRGGDRRGLGIHSYPLVIDGLKPQGRVSRVADTFALTMSNSSQHETIVRRRGPRPASGA
jgi:hypothetical protein